MQTKYKGICRCWLNKGIPKCIDTNTSAFVYHLKSSCLKLISLFLMLFTHTQIYSPNEPTTLNFKNYFVQNLIENENKENLK